LILQRLHLLERGEHVVLEDVDLRLRFDDVDRRGGAPLCEARVRRGLRGRVAQPLLLNADVAPRCDQIPIRIRHVRDRLRGLRQHGGRLRTRLLRGQDQLPVIRIAGPGAA
jgi:hypothetical protein